jgi:ubiquinone/menaquinone biosynthesis C-methylase UbiE
MSEATLEANIAVHTALAVHYDSVEPHFRPENRAKVAARLQALRARAPGGRLLDIGCGTGFVITLAAPLFDAIDGVDITPAMLERVPKLANVALHEARAEALPFDTASFDVASAYSFLDHIAEPLAVFREVARVLKPGGLFYADLNPNRAFWQSLSAIPAERTTSLSDIVAREQYMVRSNAEAIEAQFGISRASFIAAEPGKKAGGLDPAECAASLKSVGFASVEVHHDWFLGQGAVMHGISPEAAAQVEAYLRRVAPLADHLFKYFYVVATR